MFRLACRFCSTSKSHNFARVKQITEELAGRRRIYEQGTMEWSWERGRAPLWLGPTTSWLTSTFLPINAVHHCYVKFHVWQATETFVSAIVGVLCNQAMLSSLGLAQPEAVAGAVAIQWILKDGIAEMGKLLFIKRYAASFDSHPKTWKAIGEALTTIGSGLQLCTLMIHSDFFLLFAATGNIAKSTSWALWGATHTCFIRNFALANNVGDLTAKADSQGAVALISGWLTGIALISYSHSAPFLFAAYFALTPLHVLATRNLLMSAEFEILNETKAMLIIKEYLNSGDIPSMTQIKPSERFFGEYPSVAIRLPPIRLGTTLDKAFNRFDELVWAIECIPGENYVIGWKNARIHIVFHKNAEGRDALKSLLHAMKFEKSVSGLKASQFDVEKSLRHPVISELLIQSHEWTNEAFPKFIAQLDAKDWQSESLIYTDYGYRASWEQLAKDNPPV